MSTDISSDWELQRIKRELAAAQERMDAIGRIPAVRDRAGVGDGSLYDAVVALTGALEVARRELAVAQAEERKRIIEIIHGFDSIYTGVTGRIITAVLRGRAR